MDLAATRFPYFVQGRPIAVEDRDVRDHDHLDAAYLLAVALANLDDVIALIKASPTPAEAKAGLMARLWRSGAVPEMLARAGESDARPEGLGAEFGRVEEG